MAPNPLAYDSAGIATVNAFTALLNSGTIRVYTGSQPALDGSLTGTLLVTMTFNATAFGSATATGGTITATANAITSGIAGNTGAAGYFALLKSDNSTVVLTGTVGTSNADFIGPTTSITSGNTISCSAFQIQMLQTG
jgi:hypothetical protein